MKEQLGVLGPNTSLTQSLENKTKINALSHVSGML